MANDDVASSIENAPTTPAGRQAAWYLARLHAKGEGADPADRERYSQPLAERYASAATAEEARAAWRDYAGRIGDILAVAFTSKSEREVEARIDAARDRRWLFTVAVEADDPHRMTRVEWERIHEFRLEVREATVADAAILVDLERRCPIVLEDSKLWFDRGENYFDFSRLMEDCTVGLAFVDGEPAAVTCGARHTVRIGGDEKSIVTVSHLRVLPEHQRKGLWGEANRVLQKYWAEVDGSSAFIAVDNAAMQHGFRHTPDKWPQPVWWAQLECARLAAAPVGRRAMPADAAMIADLINAFRAGEEMFVPYSEASLAIRLSRAPDLYSRDRLWLADGALVGVWPAGRALRLVTERAGAQTVSQPGVVLDYAFAPGAEAAFEALLRAWCGWLAERGMDRLSIFTSPASRGANLISSLAGEVEAFNMWTPGIPVPPDAGEKGLYVDPIYF